MKTQRKSNLRQNTRRVAHFVATLLITVWLFAAVQAAPGDLDPSFGNSGIVVTPIVNLPFGEAPRSIKIQPDGKILVGGEIAEPSDGKNYPLGSSFLVRYNPNGTLDASFGIGGKVVEPFSYVDYVGRDIALQPDGKIITVGFSVNGIGHFAVHRYNSNGTLDTSFGSGGKVSTPVNYQSWAERVAVQPDGKIVVVGTTITPGTNFDYAVVRYNPDGSLDTSFGAGGKVITSVAGLDDETRAVILQPDGKIVLVGYSKISPPQYLPDVVLVRYNQNGSLDSSFGANGVFIHQSPTSSDFAIDGALQPDGKIVVLETRFNSAEITTRIVRYNPNGSLDTSFAANGIFSVPEDFFRASSIALQSNGKIVAFGYTFTSAFDSSFAVLRLNPNGSPDTDFGTNGRVLTPIGRNSGSSNGVIQRDGKILALGANYQQGYGGDIVITRYLGDAAAVPRLTQFDFDGDGKADISVFRPSDGVWYLNRSTQGFSATHFGLSSDRLAPADFDGDGKTDIAVYRDGFWYLLRSTEGFLGFQFGIAEDIPQPADFDGDGRAELAVYRPSNGTWYLFNLVNNNFSAEQFGISTDKPVVGDYDGDTRTDYAVYRASEGIWYLLQSTSGFTATQFGIASDRPVVGDYDGDGRADLAVYRLSNGTWYLLKSTEGFAATQFGIATDEPTPADYDGDGRTDLAVYRPSEGRWWMTQSTSGLNTMHFGLSDDIPVPSAFIP